MRQAFFGQAPYATQHGNSVVSYNVPYDYDSERAFAQQIPRERAIPRQPEQAGPYQPPHMLAPAGNYAYHAPVNIAPSPAEAEHPPRNQAPGALSFKEHLLGNESSGRLCEEPTQPPSQARAEASPALEAEARLAVEADAHVGTQQAIKPEPRTKDSCIHCPTSYQKPRRMSSYIEVSRSVRTRSSSFVRAVLFTCHGRNLKEEIATSRPDTAFPASLTNRSTTSLEDSSLFPNATITVSASP